MYLEFYRLDTINPAQVSILVQAHQDRPILLLEALNPALIKSITCDRHHAPSSISITLQLHSEEMAQAMTDAWAPNADTTFNVITSHFGCNEASQRGAWRFVVVFAAKQNKKKLTSPFYWYTASL